MTQPILPGATIGVLGSGQLGRMLATPAHRMGYRLAVFGPEAHSPAGQLADHEVIGSYHDVDAVRAFAARVDVLTIEFENIPTAALEAAAALTPVRPGAELLAVAQHRLREKRFLAANGFPVAPFAVVSSADDLPTALAEVGAPAVLKTAGFGYDGKGQRLVADLDEARAAAAELLAADGVNELVLEAKIDFERELSVLVARSPGGHLQALGPIENDHQHHILDVSRYPAAVSAPVAAAARDLACGVAEAGGLIGVLAVEMFQQGERLLVNEIAPRPHNSGHLTIEAFGCSQFELQLRAICDLPLLEPAARAPAAAMANLLGDLWQAGEPAWPAVLARPVALHLYGKAEARPGRKMGHLTALAPTPAAAAAAVRSARQALARNS